jgi:DNA polymerase-1
MQIVTVDFETEAIRRRPYYPPAPVGVALKAYGHPAQYYAWGHPTGNNCDSDMVADILRDLWRSDYKLVFHNSKFDVEVAERYFGLGSLPWERIHDTMFLLFLDDPYQSTLSLKPAAQKYLGMEPEERDEVKDWLVSNKICRDTKEWGANICLAPGDLVGRYAEGDVVRTEALFELLYFKIIDTGMDSAYDRERQLMRILMRNESEGIRVDKALIEATRAELLTNMDICDNYVRGYLKDPELVLTKKDDLAQALFRADAVTDWVRTKTGKLSTKKDNLTPSSFRDPKLASAIGYRSRAQTVMSTFVEPYLEQLRHTKDTVHTDWNQVRQVRGADGYGGARTGRLSSTPNFQNIPKTFSDKDDGYAHPDFLHITPLPLVRKFFLPDRGCVFCHRDYNQQELRILAHFEDDVLLGRYTEDPSMDIHTFVQDMLNGATGRQLERRAVKTLNFGLVYGMGRKVLAERLGVSEDEARLIKNAQLRAIPGLKTLSAEVARIGKSGGHITTWGGRHYYCEPPQMINGGIRTFEYKLLNYLIQGSAADCTKQAIINYDALRKDGRFLVTVHDEINLSVPRNKVASEMKLLKEAMLNVKFDVTMLSDGKVGPNWGELSPFKEK